MKRLIALLLVLAGVLVCFAACGGEEKKDEPQEEEEITIDYPNVSDFEAALENNENVGGKTVTFTVNEIDTGSMYGVLYKSNDKLAFIVTGAADVKVGDELTVTVMSSRMALNVRYIDCTLAE